MRSDWTRTAILTSTLAACGQAATTSTLPDEDAGPPLEVMPDGAHPTDAQPAASSSRSVDAGRHPTTVDATSTADTATACDAAATPSTTTCVLTEEYGVFVAPLASGGSDLTGTGTRRQPFATISYALANLGALGRVYVCNGTYVDQVTVSSAIGLYGGLTCGTAADGGSDGPWAYAPGTTATVVGASPAFALDINAASAAVDIEDMTWNATPGTMESPSSIAALVVSSSAVTLRRNTLTAAAGAAGQPGMQGAAGSVVKTVVGGQTLASTTLDGQDATSTAEAFAVSCFCPDGSITIGEIGGTAFTGFVGEDGQPTQSTPTPPGATGAAGTEATCEVGATGTRGSDAVPSVAPDGSGAASAGGLDTLGWHPSSGSTGPNGGPGQGGGGGGSVAGGNGGGGACGGCGGVGGSGGAGGGASIALVAYESPVLVEGSTLTAANGGPGGAGALGGAAQAGGAGGAPSWHGCYGGSGGTGATGGAGGGGAGGVSFAILYGGTPPSADGTTWLTAGTAGAGGAGGDPGKNDGPPGVAASLEDAASF